MTRAAFLDPTRRRIARAAAAVVLAGALASSARPALAVHQSTFTVVSGRLNVFGGEETCFRLDRGDLTTDRLRVRIRFTSAVPRGYMTLDGVRGASFSEASEEFSFVVDAGGAHRLVLELDDRATIDWLSITSTQANIRQTTCSEYEFETRRRVDVEPDAPEPIDNFERGRDRTRDSLPPAPPPPRTGQRRTEPVPTTTTRTVSVPAGTELELTLENEINTRTARAGQGFSTRIAQPVSVDGRTVLPTGATVQGHVVEAQDAGRFGRSKLTLAFDRAVLADGTEVPLQASLQRVGKGSAGKQGGIIAGSAVGGAVLGKILGGDDSDALLGAIIGGSIAAGSIASKPGESIALPAGTVLSVLLDSSATVQVTEPYTPDDRYRR